MNSYLNMPFSLITNTDLEKATQQLRNYTVIHSLALCPHKNGQIDAIFLDFSKAFDRVLHDKLILKLRKIELPEILVSWIRNYLTNRPQCVAVDERAWLPSGWLWGSSRECVRTTVVFAIH